MVPRVHIIVTGGTITMTPGAQGGIVPALTGAALVEQVPELAAVADVVVDTPCLKPGASLTPADMRELVASLPSSREAAGVVVVQGTDTIDETSFLVDLLYGGDMPVVFTGAMRGASASGADGPANLLSAVRVAASPHARGLGALVVLNDEIHAAAHVEKMHTGLASAFASPNGGRLGCVLEGEVMLLRRPFAKRPPPIRMGEWPQVAILKVGLGDDSALFEAAPDLGYGGVVVEGMGGGHVPADLVPAIKRLAGRIPVVLATRVPAGPVLRNSYGFPGSEMDLIARGVLTAGWLSPQKARLLLACLLSGGLDDSSLRRSWSERTA